MMKDRYDVIIVGGGPAGMAVADRLADLGVCDTLFVEKENYLGGVLPPCIHDGFGLTKLGRNITGPEYAEVYKKSIQDKQVNVALETTVMSICDCESRSGGEGGRQYESGLKRVILVNNDGTHEVCARCVVLSTGCRERGRGNLGLPGTRPAGIFTAGTAQAFLNLHNIMPGKRVVIVGSGDIGLIMARRLTLEGAEVICVIEKEATYGGLKRNVRQCLEDFDIPLYMNTVVSSINGRARVENIEVATLDKHGKAIDTRNIRCDTIVISAGLISENGILETESEGIFVCGNALFVHGLVDDVSVEGEAVAEEVMAFLRNEGERNHVSRYTARNIAYVRAEEKEAVRLRKQAQMEIQGSNMITCIKCPKGCEVGLDFEGAGCKTGVAYVKEEMNCPRRIVTSSVKVTGGQSQLVSVRTSAAIQKSEIFKAMGRINELEVAAPIEVGQVLEKDFMEHGIDLIATKTVDVC